MKYKFVADTEIKQHGWLSVLDDKGKVIATEEEWALIEDYELARMEAHICTPGQMIPPGDPRWYTHCQQCGLSVVGEKAYYHNGQYHAISCEAQYWERIKTKSK